MNRMHCFANLCYVLGIATVALSLDRAEAQTVWNIGKPIVSYWAGPGYDAETGPLTDAAAKQMVDVGMNLVWVGSAEELDVAKRHSLRALYIDETIIVPAALDNPALLKKLDALIDGIRNNPALYGYHLIDEPSTALFGDLSRLVAYLRERDSAHFAYIDLFPNHADPAAQLAASSHDDYLTRFVNTVKPSLLSYDHYQFAAKSDTGKYLQNLEAVGQKAKSAGIPFMNIVQAASWGDGNNRIPTPDQERFLAYTTLAYGAQGISYYVWCYPGHRGGIVQTDGTPTAIYDLLKATNREFVHVAEQCQSLQWIGAYLKGYRPGALPLGTSLLPNSASFEISGVSNTETYKDGDRLNGILFGLFGEKGASPANATFVLVTNLDYAAGKNCTVSGRGDLSIFDATTGKWTATGCNDTVLSLPPGGGVLVGLTTTIRPDVGVSMPKSRSRS
jgi:hypothetical protein